MKIIKSFEGAKALLEIIKLPIFRDGFDFPGFPGSTVISYAKGGYMESSPQWEAGEIEILDPVRWVYTHRKGINFAVREIIR